MESTNLFAVTGIRIQKGDEPAPPGEAARILSGLMDVQIGSWEPRQLFVMDENNFITLVVHDPTSKESTKFTTNGESAVGEYRFPYGQFTIVCTMDV